MARSKIKEKPKKKYYDVTHLLDRKPDVIMAFGQRSNGKTYSALKYVLEKYKKDGSMFLYLRRWSDDIKTSTSQKLFLPLPVEEIFGEGFFISYWRETFYLNDPDGDKTPIGYVTSLSDAYHKKSTPFTEVKTIIFDEFIQGSGEPIMSGEQDRYESILSTVIRDRTDVLIILLANTVSKFSIFWTYYSVDVNSMEEGDIREIEYPTDYGKLKIVAEYCPFNSEIGKDTSKYILRSKMTVYGQWEIPPTDDIPSVQGEVIKERLLFSAYDPEADITVGCFLHTSRWETIEKNEMVYYTKPHTREFLVLRTLDTRKSRYYHLTDQKSLDYHTFNDFKMMLDEIKENTEIDFVNELYRGRVFCENMFVADYFNHIWSVFMRVPPRKLL